MIYYLPGARVKTTDKYYARHKRVVKGIVVTAKVEIGEGNIIVRWISQSGNIDERLINHMVIMSKSEIEPD